MRGPLLSSFLRCLILALSTRTIVLAADSETAAPAAAPHASESAKEIIGFQSMSWRAGGLKTEISFEVLDNKDAPSAPKIPTPAGNIPARPLPKPRPRLQHASANSGTRQIPMIESPNLTSGNRFLQNLADRISVEWDGTMRRESLDWHPEIEVHCVFSVDTAKGAIIIESQASPSDVALIERFAKVLESLAPLTLPEVFRVRYGKTVRLKLNFQNAKNSPPPGVTVSIRP